MNQKSKYLSLEDEIEIRTALENNEYIPNSYVFQLIQELDYLREENKVDGPIFNLGKAEGQADVAVQLRKIVDPTDQLHLNLDGTLKIVKHLCEKINV